ncbi:MAG: D-alanyl-D-alanine carboxypeptidase [Candidatus Adiutrix sp.]|jgi:D-alanyl-D-alanine carboxypeptidase/D-alanyl-D-alanine-endopeptidase (penicillin-binding protein 4)|nr:D-alanyl-D-alanine carboxypeptidase [Candidatus Adiutrix sp.]
MIGKWFHNFKLLVPAIAAAAFLLCLGAMGPEALLAAPKKGGAVKSAKNSGSQSSGQNKSDPLPWPQNLLALLGDGAVLVVDHHAPQGARELYAHNAEKFYVPASILKIVTAGAALEFLGPEYRFKTDFLLTKNHDLWVVGYGDPYMVSEELARAIKALQERGLKQVRNIYIDASYFERGLILDGNSQTRSPYDAYNGAFSVNFNTVSFKKNKKGAVSRANDRIPLTPFAQALAAKTKGSGSFSLNISESPQAAEEHAGQLLKAQLEEAGVPVSGQIFAGHTAPERRRVFYRHVSSRPLEEVLRDLLKYSNNFMTNQIFLAMGAERFGAPATLEKAQMVMSEYFTIKALPPIVMGDGSGLSRQTTVTARQMAEVLKEMEPERFLFTSKDNGQVYFKTGTMSDIKTLAGYLERPGEPGRPLSFVILLNGAEYRNDARDKILDILKAEFISPPSAGE